MGSRTTAVLVLLGAAWLIAVPVLLLQGFLAGVPVFGTTGDPAVARAYLTWAAVLGGVLPPAGVVLAALTRRRAATWFFGVALALAVTALALDLADDVRHRPASPEPRHCVERSGGGTGCPGG